MLAYVFSAIDTYLRRIADDKLLNIDDGTRLILRKSITRPGGVAFSVADRFAALGNQFSGNQRADEILVEVLCAWRNQSTHEDGNVSVVKTRLSVEIQEELAGFSEQIAKQYGDLSILEMLDHMQKNHAPSRKDIVALVSASQNFVRSIDMALLKKTFDSYGSLERYAFDALARALGDGRQLRTLWAKDVKTRSRRLKAILEEAGFSPADGPQLRLQADFVQEVATLSFAGISGKIS